MHYRILLSLLLSNTLQLAAAEPQGQRYELAERASVIDPAAKEHPEINFVFQTKGKPADLQHASVDTRVKPQGKLVIWLMGHSAGLFERLNSYGLHAIRVHYANGWFGQYGNESIKGDGHILGNIRLEAATGQDFSDKVNIPHADGIMERSYQFLKWLAKKNPEGQWQQFLSKDGKGVDWSKVTLSGSSHGSTTAARFAKHQAVDRVVMLCGPRDNYESWQALPSATPVNRYFAFSHVLDGGWTADHYCRSWQMLGLHQLGPIINVDQIAAPYANTRRLISDADVAGNANRAHSAVTPGSASPKNADGSLKYEAVWRYLYTHPVDSIGTATAADPDCCMDQKARDAEVKKKSK